MTMAGSLSDDYLPPSGSLPVEWSTSMQHCQSVESLAEWRSCDQVENGVPSTSPPYWDSDDGDDSGPKPSDLFVKYTWKIESFSQTSKRELKSEVFEVGGYKWYILVYPQGCDVCNHLSLFLCVANHDKLLPGWSHFAQFTITVLNKDPKKNKYSDTLHRFWKKEHDWGWKKFMELTKVMDGFVVDDGSLTIKAQVQVIREKAHRPFRCLDCQYRREIIRVYLSNVEQTYAHFIQERRKKLQDLLNDKAKWSSFRAFWLGIDQATRRCMSRDKTDLILKVAVKHFFIEKEVASTLIMDSLYTGLKALESQSKIEKVRMSLLEKEEFPAPFIVIENDMFILADDVFLLLERAASELPHPPLPAKEEKGLPNRSKDGCSGEEFNKDSIIRDERRLTELGRRTLEIFVLAHIFSSKIEIAYQEAVALKRQEELIREEAAEQAENVTRERRTKKKQAKQRRNNRKGKDRGKSEKSVEMIDEKNQLPESPVERISDEFSSDKACPVNGETDPRGDVSDVCDGGDDDAEAPEPDTEGRDTSSLSWDAETSEVHSRTEVIATEVQNGHMKKKSTSTDDSLSSCSTDSVPSVVVNTQFERNSSRNNKKKRTSNRGKQQRNKDTGTSSTHNRDQILYASGTCGATEPEHEGALKNQIQKSEPHVEKEEVAVTLGNILIDSDPVEEKLSSKSGAAVEPSPSSSEPSREPLSVSAKNDKVSTRGLTSSTSTTQTEKPVSLSLKSLQKPALPKPEALKHNFEATTSSTYSVSRPSSTPVILSQKRTVPLISSSQARPVLSRTLSSINCSDTKPSPFAQSFEPKSYRNAIVGIKSATNRSEFTPEPSSSSIYQPSTALSMSSNIGQTSLNMGFFGSHCQFNDNTSSSRQSQGVMPDEFPHLDIINDLLDEDQIVGRASISGYHHYHDDYSLNQQYAFPQDSCQFDLPEYYYDELSQMVSFVPFPGLSDLSVYGNGMDAILQNQWPIDGGDLSMMNFGNPMDVNGYGYGYQLPEYPTSGVNGYNMMYQPANGP